MKYNLKNSFVNIRDNQKYLAAIKKALTSEKGTTFFYLNSYSFYLANTIHEFNRAFNKADYIIADGYSIIFALKFLHKIKIEKVVFTYTFFNNLIELFSKHKSRIFFLGATESAINKSVFIVRKNYPNLNIVGYSDGYLDMNNKNKGIINKINSAKPDVLICGMGMPHTEIWIQNNLNKLNAKCIFSVGGFFDFLSKNKIIAPEWMFNSGFEWVFRLIQEPSRLIFRYLKANTYFLYTILKLYFSHREKSNSL